MEKEKDINSMKKLQGRTYKKLACFIKRIFFKINCLNVCRTAFISK